MFNLKQFILALFLLFVVTNFNAQPDPPDGCINVFVINNNVICTAEYDPVCGCDGVTYSNACVAYNYYGVTEWTAGECGTQPQSCFDLADIDFGLCQAVLGIGILNGECVGISGCGYIVNEIDYSSYFFEDLESCIESCPSDTSCFDLMNIDFGPCDMYMGIGLIDGQCQNISGCGYLVGDVDYSDYFFLNLEECQLACENTIDCIDPNQIDLEIACFTVYEPVCGCDGETYSNACVAYNWHGVTEWTAGECTPVDTTCFDLLNIDFGECEMYMGIGLIDGQCQSISGCGYLVDEVDYSDYFFLSLEACQIACENSIGCIDPNQINEDIFCTLEYSPVCGCDGVTYSNACVAYNWHGVTEFTNGECAPVDTSCFDLINIDFGDCDMDMGVGLIDGQCQNISGCGYLVNEVDYSDYFFLNLEECQIACENSVDCIDPDQINLDIACDTDYTPVCGCDGVTYSNACVAYNWHGVTDWTEGECNTIVAPPCSDLSNIDFGLCDMVLGIGVFNGECQTISGCDYIVDGVDYSTSLFETEEACSTQCLTDTLCYDFTGLDFGDCEMILGIGIIEGGCEYISGCSTYLDGVDYSSFFWVNIEDCMYYCLSTDCIDLTVIDPNYICTEEYNPVCGCDNITYSNECVAYYQNGITEWSPGACSVNDSLCFDLLNIDFGDCAMPLGIGVIDGGCEMISGCGYLVNNVDYSIYFYDNMESCEEWCENTDNIDNIEQLNYSVYPNPSSGFFNITFENNESRKIFLKNYLGQVVLRKEIETKSTQIDTKGLAKGVYYLLIEQKMRTNSATKIIIE